MLIQVKYYIEKASNAENRDQVQVMEKFTSFLRKCTGETQSQRSGLRNYTLILHSCLSRWHKSLKQPSKHKSKTLGCTICLDPKHRSDKSKVVRETNGEALASASQLKAPGQLSLP